MRISDWSSDVCSSDLGATDAAAAALSAAGILARVKGKILWCLTQSDLFAPALALAGLDPDRVIYVEARDETSLLRDRKSVVSGKGVSVRVDLGGRRIIKKTKQNEQDTSKTHNK